MWKLSNFKTGSEWLQLYKFHGMCVSFSPDLLTIVTCNMWRRVTNKTCTTKASFIKQEGTAFLKLAYRGIQNVHANTRDELQPESASLLCLRPANQSFLPFKTNHMRGFAPIQIAKLSQAFMNGWSIKTSLDRSSKVCCVFLLSHLCAQIQWASLTDKQELARIT